MAQSQIYTANVRPQELWEGIKTFWNGKSATITPIYPRFTRNENSDKKFELYSERAGIGLPVAKAETKAIDILTPAQGIQPQLFNQAIALGIEFSRESIKDNLYVKEGRDKIEDLRMSFSTKMEFDGADLFNNGFNTAFLMKDGDTKPLFSTAHRTNAADYSNRLAINAALSETSIEDLIIQAEDTNDSSGLHRSNIKPTWIHIPTKLQFVAKRILNSILQNNSANNAINVLNQEGYLKDIIINTYLDDPEAWFIGTSANGLIYQDRESLELFDDVQTRQMVYCYYGYVRYAFGWDNARGVFAGNSGLLIDA